MGRISDFLTGGVHRALRRIDSGGASVADYDRALTLLRRSRRFEEAEALGARACDAFPEASTLLSHFAEIASQTGRINDAEVRWRAVIDGHPDNSHAWHERLAALRVLSRLDDARSIADEAIRRFPNDVAIRTEVARTRERCGEPAAGLKIWRALLAERPWSGMFAKQVAFGLIKTQQLDEAEHIIRRYRRIFFRDPTFVLLLGKLEMARQSWDAAIVHLTEYRRRAPDDQAGWENIGLCLSSKYLADIDQGRIVAATRPVDVGRVEDEASRQLLLGFESLGGDCEFGMVQRRFGAEPLGLLRWNYVIFESLLAAMEARFADMGEPEQTEFWPDSTVEYFVQDKRWGLPMHTFQSPADVASDTLLPKMIKRLQYLREKLIADLADGEKIFVYKAKSLLMADMRRLHAAIRSFGPAHLVCVVVTGASSDLPSGTAGEAIALGDGLHLGFLSHIGNESGYWDIAFDEWLAICRQVSSRSNLDEVAA